MTYKISRKPVYIDDSVEKTCVSLRGCCGGYGLPDEENTVIRIKKAGTCTYLIEYPAEIDGENICFEWDELMYDLDCGRYIGDIFDETKKCDDCPIGSIQFEIGDGCYQVGFEIPEEEEDVPECDPPECDC